MFPCIPLVSGSGLLVGPGHFSSNSSTFLKTGEILISPEKKTHDQMCIEAARKKQARKSQARTGRKKNEELASEELNRFMTCTSSSFDGNVLKIFNELNTLHQIHLYWK